MKTLSTYTEILPNGFAFPMRYIPEGKFDMGSANEDENADSSEKPQRKDVQVAAFYMGIYTVTQALWKAVMGEENNPSGFQGDDRPVENISWYEAQKFIESLNRATESRRKGQGIGAYRLPTEAEWEYAARGGPLNDRYLYSGSNQLVEVGWFNNNLEEGTREVGLLLPNQLGLYDMSGNVLEWVEDCWYDNYVHAPANARARLSEIDDTPRVLRGGNVFSSEEKYCRVANRTPNPPSNQTGNVGFRLALSPAQDKR